MTRIDSISTNYSGALHQTAVILDEMRTVTEVRLVAGAHDVVEGKGGRNKPKVRPGVNFINMFMRSFNAVKIPKAQKAARL